MSDKTASTVDNPWRYSLTNCISGDNYLRSSEYYQLIAELDRLYVIEEQAKAAALLPSAADEPVAWMNTKAGTYFAAKSLADVRRESVEAAVQSGELVPLFTRPASARPSAGVGKPLGYINASTAAWLANCSGYGECYTNIVADAGDVALYTAAPAPPPAATGVGLRTLLAYAAAKIAWQQQEATNAGMSSGQVFMNGWGAARQVAFDYFDATPPPADAVRALVDEAMVERALVALVAYRNTYRTLDRDAARAALQAALSAPPPADAVRALVGKWRAEMKTSYGGNSRKVLRWCADELQAALSAAPVGYDDGTGRVRDWTAAAPTPEGEFKHV